MATTYRRTRNKHGDPVLHITVTGAHDIFRLNWNLLHAQCEFSAAARKTYQWLRRSMGAPSFDYLDKSLTGGKAKRYAMRPRKEEW